MRHSDVKNKIISHCWKKFEGNSTIVEITLSRWEHFKQECIPVGCVPAAHWPYAAVYFPGGVCLVWGGLLLRGGLPGPGGCLPGLGGSPWSAGGVCLAGPGGLLLPEGSAWLVRRWGIPPCTEADPPHGQNSWHTLVKILPWPNFIAAGNKQGPCVYVLNVRPNTHM